MSVNKVFIQGNLGADPEVKFISLNGEQRAVTSLSIATNERVKGADGNWTEKTEWFRVSVFGKVAENCGKYLKKGSPVFAEAKLRNRKYKDKEGRDIYTIDILADNIQFINAGNKNPEVGNYNSYNSGAQAQSVENTFATTVPQLDESAVSFNDDDIPF